MAVNAVAPWEGTLEWIGEVREGNTKIGNPYKSVEFAVKYRDSQMEDRVMVFSMFDVDKVNTLLSLPIGTEIKVHWRPDANWSSSTGKYYPKNNVSYFEVKGTKATSATPRITAPNYPEPPQNMRAYDRPNSAYARQPQPPLPTYDGPTDAPSDDLPF